MLRLGLSLLGADATAQTRATLVPAPEEASNTILVLDYSNFIWRQIEGVPKIGIVRNIIESNLAEWTQSTQPRPKPQPISPASRAGRRATWV
ncbi:MAG: hypothetical protein CME02_10810 [Geminicoccus sp.]|nr:hypothetical protein [Geminicoccus sp.]